jgi:hypothetical protein
VTPLLIVSLLFWSTLALTTISLALDKRLLTTLRLHWKAIAVVLVVTALWRIPTDGVFFHGLEYEDSYVYTVAGRQLAEHVGAPSQDLQTPFSISVCAVGDLKACQEWESFPEHLIGYPYVIGLASRAFRYTPSVGSIVNLLAALVSALLVFILALTIARDSTAGLLAGLVFAVIPVFATYGLETSAEPFSGCCMLVSLWFLVRLCDGEHTGFAIQASGWGAYTCALLFSLTVKREDALLALVLPAVIPFVVSRNGTLPHARRSLVGLVILSSVLAVLLGVKMRLLQTTAGEQELLRRFPLTVARFAGFVGSFLSSFLVIGWYGGSFFAVIVGAILALRRRDLTILPVVLLVAFIILYSSHIRGYYEMESGRILSRSALRFSMNLMGLWAIVAGMGLGFSVEWILGIQVIRSHQRLVQYSSAFISIAFLIASFITTLQLRRDSVEDEMISRVRPALNAVNAAEVDVPGPAYILTMDPLVVQMYGRPETRVIDLESVDTQTISALVEAKSRLILLKQTDRFTDVDLRRYGKPIRYALSFPSRVVASGLGFQVVSLEPALLH